MTVTMKGRYQTREGDVVEILRDNVRNEDFPIVGIITFPNGSQEQNRWQANGKYNGYEPENPLDLVPAMPTGWHSTCEKDKQWVVTERVYPPIIEWAQKFFEQDFKESPVCGHYNLLIEAGRRRGKTTLGLIAGIKFWEKHPENMNGGWVSVPESDQKLFVLDALVSKFHGKIINQHVVSVPTKVGNRLIAVYESGSPLIQGRHDIAWLFFDNIDLALHQDDMWKDVMHADPLMLIVSQNRHSFAARLFLEAGWNVLIDHTIK